MSARGEGCRIGGQEVGCKERIKGLSTLLPSPYFERTNNNHHNNNHNNNNNNNKSEEADDEERRKKERRS